MIDYAQPTLVELGVNPSPLEENITWILRHHKHRAYIQSQVSPLFIFIINLIVTVLSQAVTVSNNFKC